MKKTFKKIGAALLTLCLTVSCFSFVVFAAEGTLQFSDPSGAAGENVTVTAKVISGAEGVAVGDTDITVTYDPSILKFVSGTNATGGDGTVKLSAKGDGTATEVNYSMEFTALKEGTTTLEAKEYTAYLASDETLNLTLGTSQVTIEGGTPVSDEEAGEKDNKASSGGLQVTVDGKTYTVNENFSEAAIPNGFVAADTELDGQSTKAMLQESSGQYMFYLQDSEGNSDYFLYSSDDGSFAQTAVVDVNSTFSIYLMDHKDKEGLPSEYKETTTDISGKVFTAWQNTSEKEYYLVYALSSEGTKGYYQYDTTEKTYQRYTVPVVEKKESSNTLTDKLSNFINKYMTIIMCAVWGVFLIMLVIIIVLAVKLSRRNQELDDLYDEYDIDGDDPDDLPKTRKKDREQFVGFQDDDDVEYEDEYNDDYDDDFEEYDDDFEDEYSEDDNDYDDEFEEYEEEETPSPRNRKKKEDDDYSVDFIDL